MEKFSILKNVHFSGKDRQSLYINITRIHKMLIYCIKLDHALYSINYGNYHSIDCIQRYEVPLFLVLI